MICLCDLSYILRNWNHSDQMDITGDDHEPILSMVGRMLSNMGYETSLTIDGDHAIGMFEEAYSSENPFE